MIKIKGKQVQMLDIEISEQDLIKETISLIRNKNNFTSNSYVTLHNVLEDEGYGHMYHTKVIRAATETDKHAYSIIEYLNTLLK